MGLRSCGSLSLSLLTSVRVGAEGRNVVVLRQIAVQAAWSGETMCALKTRCDGAKKGKTGGSTKDGKVNRGGTTTIEQEVPFMISERIGMLAMM